MDVLLALSIPVFTHTRWRQQGRGGETALRWSVPDQYIENSNGIGEQFLQERSCPNNVDKQHITQCPTNSPKRLALPTATCKTWPNLASQQLCLSAAGVELIADILQVLTIKSHNPVLGLPSATAIHGLSGESHPSSCKTQLVSRPSTFPLFSCYSREWQRPSVGVQYPSSVNNMPHCACWPDWAMGTKSYNQQNQTY